MTLFGLPIVTERKINYGPIDPLLCRELFIRHGLVEGDWQTRHAFFRMNLKLLAEVEELEHKSRRRIFWSMTRHSLTFMIKELVVMLSLPSILIAGGSKRARRNPSC